MRRLGVLILGGLLLAGCGQGEPPVTDTGQWEVGREIGMLAAEIEGVDLDGVEFRLSDYRGKVVVLDFWGDW